MKTTVFEPRHDYVLVRLHDAEGQTPGGIFVPEQAQDQPKRATVIAVGPGRLALDGSRLPLDLQIDQTILINEFGGISVDPFDKSLVLVRETEIIASIIK